LCSGSYLKPEVTKC